MEQLGHPPRNPSVPATDRDIEVTRHEHLSLSEPTVNVTPHLHDTNTSASTSSTSSLLPTTPTASPTSTRDPLSTSEPTLRFPRPQGNRHLANWISSSNPDIMRVTPNDDASLSGSTYEFITGTDTESQDGAYNESMSESVSSLDFHRPDDDATSLAGTEQTFDDESLVDGFEPIANPVHAVQEVETDVEAFEEPAQSQTTITASRLDNDADAEYESEDEAASRSSLDYTQQSLKTPSIPTPEASKIVDRSAEVADTIPTADEDEDSDAETTRGSWASDLYKGIRGKEVQARNVIRETGFHIPPVVILLIALFIPVLFSTSSPPSDLHRPATTTVITTHTTTATISITSTSTTTHALATPTGNGQLVPLENVQQDEKLWGRKKLDLAVFKQQHGQYLISIPPKVKEKWLSRKRKCLSFYATRGLVSVPIDISVAEGGIIVKFPQTECHGSVQVEITAQCGPRIHQTFRITFEKGIVEEALEKTKQFAQNLTDLVPAAAQKAERHIEEARRSLEMASDNVLTASDGLLKDLLTRFRKAHRTLSPIKADAQMRFRKTRDHLSKRIDEIKIEVADKFLQAQDVQDQAQLGLLDAQISAKLWWLKVMNKTEHERYASKAKEYLADKRTKATQAFLSRHPCHKDKSTGPCPPCKKATPCPPCKKAVLCPRCSNKLGRGKRMQQCNFAV